MRAFILLALIGCSSVGTPMEPMIDAMTGGRDSPAVSADASPFAEACEMYCECMVSVCDWQDALGCVSTCTQIMDPTVRDCRVVHCGLAQDALNAGDEPNHELHCMHSRGMGLCEGS